MGSGQSAVVVVKLDHLTAHPGDNITGKIYLDVRADSIECSSVDLVITGTENTYVTYSTGSGKNKRSHHAREKHLFLNSTVALADMQAGRLPKGNYEFPFSFVLPLGVPSSMVITGSSHCSIKYEATGIIRNHQKSIFGAEDKGMTGTTPFAVFSGVTSIPHSPLYIDPKSAPATFWFCYEQGNILLGMSCETSVWVPGETRRINYMVQNNSTATIKAIKFELVEHLQFFASVHTSRWSVEHISRRLEASRDRNETKIELACLEKHEKPVPDTADQLLGLKTQLDSGNVSVDVLLPADARESYQGRNIFVRHSLTMTVVTTFGTCNIEADCPITVANKLTPTKSQEEATHYPASFDTITKEISQEQVRMDLPAYWRPQLASPVQLNCELIQPPSRSEEREGKAEEATPTGI